MNQPLVETGQTSLELPILISRISYTSPNAEPERSLTGTPRPLNAHPDFLRTASQRPAPTLRSPGGATTQTEKSTPVHTSIPSSAGCRTSPCGVPSADERRLSLPHRAAGLAVSTKTMLNTGPNNGPVPQHHGQCQPKKRGDSYL